jgi:hypothetical protein
VTRDELAQALAAAGVDDREFDLNGSTSSDDAWVLEDDHGIWRVYYQERGKRYDEQHFLSENEACLFMLSKLASVASPE